MIYLVVGEYSDYAEHGCWHVRAFASEEKANALADYLTNWCNANGHGTTPECVAKRSAAYEAYYNASVASYETWCARTGVGPDPGRQASPEEREAYSKRYQAAFEATGGPDDADEGFWDPAAGPPEDPQFETNRNGTRYRVEKIPFTT